VLDVAMPGLGGVEAAEAIRVRSPRTRIVAVSMYSDALYRKRMLAAGAVAYLLKMAGLVKFAIRAGIAPLE
jgi:DNA-binding NarL/FixJ family response regulator